jgi:hypothetical protein
MKNVVEKDGELFVSVDAMLFMLKKMVQQRDKLVAEDPDNEVFVPGSDAAINILGNMLVGLRAEYFSEADLSQEAAATLKELYGFLDEQ